MLERDLVSNNLNTQIGVKDLKRVAVEANICLLKTSLSAIGRLSTKVSAKLALDLFSRPMTSKRKLKGLFSTTRPNKILVGDNFIQTFEFGEGEAILLTHGWQGQASDFHHYIEPLVQSGYKVIAFDGPAHGSSTGNTTNIVEFAEVIHALSQRYNGFKAIIAHSFGGAASTYALANFHNMRCEKLINIGVPNKIGEVFSDFSKSMGLRSSVQVEMQKALEQIAGRSIDEITCAKMIQKSNVKTLLVHDQKDLIVPFRNAEAVKEECPDVELLETIDLGHVKILRDKEVLKDIIEFIFKSK